MPNFDDKYRRYTKGGPTTLVNVGSLSTNQWYGDTLVVSRDQIVNAPLVRSTSRVALTPHWYGPTSYGVAVAFQVGCVAAGSYFYISTINSVGFAAAGAASCAVWWEISNP